MNSRSQTNIFSFPSLLISSMVVTLGSKWYVCPPSPPDYLRFLWGCDFFFLLPSDYSSGVHNVQVQAAQNNLSTLSLWEGERVEVGVAGFSTVLPVNSTTLSDTDRIVQEALFSILWLLETGLRVLIIQSKLFFVIYTPSPHSPSLLLSLSLLYTLHVLPHEIKVTSRFKGSRYISIMIGYSLF